MITHLFKTQPGLEDVVDEEFQTRVMAAGIDPATVSFDRNDSSGELVAHILPDVSDSPGARGLPDTSGLHRVAGNAAPRDR